MTCQLCHRAWKRAANVTRFCEECRCDVCAECSCEKFHLSYQLQLLEEPTSATSSGAGTSNSTPTSAKERKKAAKAAVAAAAAAALAAAAAATTKEADSKDASASSAIDSPDEDADFALPSRAAPKTVRRAMPQAQARKAQPLADRGVLVRRAR